MTIQLASRPRLLLMCLVAIVVAGCRGPADRVSSAQTSVWRIHPGREAMGDLAWSPDGRCLLTSDRPSGHRGRARLHLVEAATGLDHELGTYATGPPPSFAPDGRRILLQPAGGGSPKLALRDATTGQDEVVCRFAQDRLIYYASLSPSGQFMAIHEVERGARPASVMGHIRLVDLRAGTSRCLGRPALDMGSPSWSGRSDLAWDGGEDQGILLARPHDYVATAIAPPLKVCAVLPGSWSPDGSQLLVESLGREALEVSSIAVDTGQVTRVVGVPGIEFDFGAGVAWSPDRALVAIGAQRAEANGQWSSYIALHSMDSRSPTDIRLIGPFKGGVTGLAWSPSGDALAYVSGDAVQMLQVAPAG